MTDYTLKYTGAYGRQDKSNIKPQEIKVLGDCSIMNYDPRTTSTMKKGLIKIDFSNGQTGIKEGVSVDSTPNIADFSEKKAKVLVSIAALGGDKKAIDIEDINKIKTLNKTEFGLKDIKADCNAGVATLVWGDDDLLRIVFKTETNNVKEKLDVKPAEEDGNISKTLENAKGMYDELYERIPKDYDKYIRQVAKNAGVSEDLVRFIIMSEGEAGTCKAKLGAYKCSSGQWTIGFGHTNNCRNDDEVFGAGKKITLKEAFQLLEDDLKEIKRLTRHRLTKENFDNLPESLQGLCIDYYFQVGSISSSKKANLSSNIEGEFFGPLAAGSLFRGGDLRRSANAFMLAVKDLSQADRKNAINSLVNKGYYSKIVNFLSGAEKNTFVEFCNTLKA